MAKDSGQGGEVMGPAELKPLLHLAKRKPVSCAIAMTKDKQGVILLHKRTKPRKLMAELLRQGKGSGLELDRTTIRFGRASVDGGSDSSTVVFTVNKEAPGPLRMALVVKLRPAGFQRCEIVVDETLENEGDEDESEEDESDAATARPQQDVGSASRPPAPIQDEPSTASLAKVLAASPPNANLAADLVSSLNGQALGLQPNAEVLKTSLRGLAEQIRPVIAADPSRKEPLLKLATDARDSLVKGDLASAQSGIVNLRQALGAHAGDAGSGSIGRGTDPDSAHSQPAVTPPGASQDATDISRLVRPASDIHQPVPRNLGEDTGLPGLEHVAADGSAADPNPPPTGASFLHRAGNFLKDPHTALGAASFAPSGFGSAASAADGVLYGFQGDKVNAGISLGAAAIGVVSDAGAARLAMKGVKAGTEALSGAGKAAEVASDAGKVGHAATDAGKISETGEAASTAARGEHARSESGSADHATTGPQAGAAATAAAESKPLVLTLRGVQHELPGWQMQALDYAKRTPEARQSLRSSFPAIRKDFVKNLATKHTDALQRAGVSADDIAMLKDGLLPKAYQVHHKIPLDDGGTNATENLVLMKNDPDHQLITIYQNSQTRGMTSGQTRSMEWPVPKGQIDIWPQVSGSGARPVTQYPSAPPEALP